MRDRIKPGRPLSGTLRPDLPPLISPSQTDAPQSFGLILFPLCSILEAKPEREFPDGQHHIRLARDA